MDVLIRSLDDTSKAARPKSCSAFTAMSSPFWNIPSFQTRPMTDRMLFVDSKNRERIHRVSVGVAFLAARRNCP